MWRTHKAELIPLAQPWKYKELADKETNIIFGGHLGEYRYYDMDATVASVLNMCEKEFNGQLTAICRKFQNPVNESQERLENGGKILDKQ